MNDERHQKKSERVMSFVQRVTFEFSTLGISSSFLLLISLNPMRLTHALRPYVGFNNIIFFIAIKKKDTTTLSLVHDQISINDDII